jgi:hypothetical protein
MRALYLIVSSLVLFGAALATLPLASINGRPDSVEITLASFGALLLVLGPQLAGGFLMSWPKDPRSADSRTYVLRYGIISGSIGLVGAALLIVLSVVVGAPFWMPLVIVVVVALLFAVALAAGEGIRRRAERAPQPVFEHPGLSVDYLRNKNRWALIAFFIGMIASFALMLLTYVLFDAHAVDPLSALSNVLLAIGFGMLSSAFVYLPALFKVQASLRTVIKDDLTIAPQLRRVVLRGKPDLLSPEQRVVAVRWASLVSSYLPVQVRMLLLALEGGLVFQIPNLVRRVAEGEWFVPTMYGAAIVAFVAVIPFSLRQARRAKSYTEAHLDVLQDAGVEGV